MSRVIKIFTLPFLVFAIGSILYFLAFYFIHQPAYKTAVSEVNISAIASKAENLNTPEQILEAIKEEESKQETPNEENTSEATQPILITDALEKNTSEQNTTEAVEIPIEQPSLEYIACYVVDTPVLNVREEAGIEGKVLGQVRMGDVVCSLEEKYGWIKSELGWIYSNKLIRVDTSRAQEALKTFQ